MSWFDRLFAKRQPIPQEFTSILDTWRRAAQNETDPAIRQMYEKNLAHAESVIANFKEVATVPLKRVELDFRDYFDQILEASKSTNTQMITMRQSVTTLHHDNVTLRDMQRQAIQSIGELAVFHQRLAERINGIEATVDDGFKHVNEDLTVLRTKQLTVISDVDALKKALAELNHNVLSDRLTREQRTQYVDKLESIPADTDPRLVALENGQQRLQEQMQYLLDRLEEKSP